ncbi:GATA zinc finger domain-containing protein 14 [Condylostylus longicornis]|uniref:GATA zinc finger domain-containing protein 14 n=1 Tax=Condylostylus longicornis TaxID=2530218 RepID=UPI00244E142E|nr:GATA zinc finger domain-containing protein 14 [Condylostylus longicornis]
MAKNLDEIINMIKNLDLQDDGICMNHKIKAIELDFCNIVKDEQMLSDSMDYINQKVLEDCDAALKFAMLFSSRNFDSLAMHDTKVRCKMLNILQKNFSNAEMYRKENKNMLYNSVTLLGEYYNRVRLADGSPIDILGESLLQLLTQEIEFGNTGSTENLKFPNMDFKLSKLILSQVTLNGSILRSNHKNELNTLLFYVRKNLIEQPNLNASVKALLLMTLDLYYNNFTSLTPALEEMYTKYLLEEENQKHDTNSEKKSFEELPVINKKWSEQVCEDSMYELEAQEVPEMASNNNSLCGSQNNINIHDDFQYQSLPPRPTRYDEEQDNVKPSSRREYFPRRINKNRSMSPQNNTFSIRQASSQPRPYNGSHNDKYVNRNNRNSNRYSANFEEDRSSVRSEGGSIKLYNAGDYRHSRTSGRDIDSSSRDRMSAVDRNSWDRGGEYNSYDGRRRSSSRSQQDNNYNNNNGNNNRSRNTYDRPPRFRNLDNQSWRIAAQEKKYDRSSSKGSESRGSSMNHTFPRSHRQGSYDNYNGENFRSSKNNLLRNQTPEINLNDGSNETENFNSKKSTDKGSNADLSNNQRPQQSRNFGRSNNDKYGSHYSLSSVDSGTWQRRGRPKNRNSYRRRSQDWDDTRSLHENYSSSDNKWDNLKDNELVKNARNTTKYMQYLSRKN